MAAVGFVTRQTRGRQNRIVPGCPSLVCNVPRCAVLQVRRSTVTGDMTVMAACIVTRTTRSIGYRRVLRNSNGRSTVQSRVLWQKSGRSTKKRKRSTGSTGSILYAAISIRRCEEKQGVSPVRHLPGGTALCCYDDLLRCRKVRSLVRLRFVSSPLLTDIGPGEVLLFTKTAENGVDQLFWS